MDVDSPDNARSPVQMMKKAGLARSVARSSLLAAFLFVSGATCLAAPAPDQATPFSGQAFETSHSGVFNGKPIDYIATFGETILRNEDGDEVASIFATSYVREDNSQDVRRPVVFLWNGGPSAASQALHMAGFGPVRLAVPEDVTAPSGPPHGTIENPHTILDVADLVFVDPAETGFSRVLPQGDRTRFYSVDGDAESIALFIRNWLRKNDREDSPRYVVGTSYGSIRAAVVAGILAESSMPLDGVVLFSQGVNLVETTQREHNMTGYASNMSQQAAIAWYHGRTALQEKSVFEVIDIAHDFAMREYLVALGQGRSLPDAERESIAARLSELTGIGRSYWIDNHLMIKKSQFRRELLKGRGLVLGATDARYTAPVDSEDGPAHPTQGVEDVHRKHMADFLGVTLPMEEYRAVAPDAFRDWGWGGTSTLDGSKAPPGALRTVFADFDYASAITPAFDANGNFRVMIATGIYDTLTTAGPARLLAGNVAWPDDRIEVLEYAGGHAFYSNLAEFRRLANDLREFVRD